jgi:excisionase family DNA binding protein
MQLLTIQETAQTLHVSIKTVRRHIENGRIPALRLPGSKVIRVPESSLINALEPVHQATAATDLTEFINRRLA